MRGSSAAATDRLLHGRSVHRGAATVHRISIDRVYHSESESESESYLGTIAGIPTLPPFSKLVH